MSLAPLSPPPTCRKPSTFAVELAPATITLSAGRIGVVVVNLSGVGAFTGSLTLAYGALPAYASGAFTLQQ